MQHESVFAVFPNLPSCTVGLAGKGFCHASFATFPLTSRSKVTIWPRLAAAWAAFLIFGRIAGTKAASAAGPDTGSGDAYNERFGAFRYLCAGAFVLRTGRGQLAGQQ